MAVVAYLRVSNRKTVFRESARGNYTLCGEEWVEHRQMVHGDGQRKSE